MYQYHTDLYSLNKLLYHGPGPDFYEQGLLRCIFMQDENKLASHVEDIKRALNTDLSEEQIKDEIEIYTEKYGVPLGNAKRSIIKKYGGDPQSVSKGVEKKIEDITSDEKGLAVKGRIVSINSKEIEKDGETSQMRYGILGDDTGTIQMNLWKMTPELEQGDTVKMENTYTNEWQGEAQLQVGDRSTIEKIEDDEVPSHFNQLNVDDIRKDMNGVVLSGRVMSVEEKTFTTDDGEEKSLFSGILADKTGKIQFTAWHDFGLNEGDVIEVQGGYSNEFRGMPQFAFSDNANVNKLPEDELPSKEELEKISTRVKSIGELAERGSGIDVAVEAVMIDIKDGSGLIFRCPECKRVIQKGACRVHGKVEGQADLRVKGVLDDESGALTVIMNRELTEDVLGYDLEKAMEIAKDEMNQAVIKDDIEDVLMAQSVTAKGNVSTDDYGVMLIANDIEMNQVDVEKEAEMILDEIQEVR